MKLHILILTLATEQATLRMRVWRNLKTAGAAALRDGVYLLPDVAGAAETFHKMSDEILKEGGGAFVFAAEAPEEQVFRPLFDRAGLYGEFLKSLQSCRGVLNAETVFSQIKAVRKLRREFDRIVAIDFFPGESKTQAASALTALELEINRLISPGEPHAEQGEMTLLSKNEFCNRLWATRRRPWIDRLASAWLIKRFIDGDARFLWLENISDCPPDAVGFDYDGALFSHVDGRVTFEVLIARFGLECEALNGLGMLVHYLDVGGVQPPDAPGVESILAGLRETIMDDDLLLSAACSLFDGLLMTYEMRSGHHEQNDTHHAD